MIRQLLIMIILFFPLISVAKTLIVCEGTEKVWMSIFGDVKDSKNVVETWSIENNKLNGLNDCPLAGSNMILCSLTIPSGSIPGMIRLMVTYELDRVSGFFKKRQETITTMEWEIKNNPLLRNLPGSEVTFFTRITNTEGYCKRGANKF
jgi:hypothetical protein